MSGKPIVNAADAPTHAASSGEHFAYAMTELAGPCGARSIGANLTRVPPGKAAFPLHHHQANEEHFFVLSGSGVLRLGDETHQVRPNDYIVNVPGGPEQAHQLVNTGDEDLVYLAISTLVLPEVVGYVDSAKTGVRISRGTGPGSRFLVRQEDCNAIGYWEAEDGRAVREIVARARERR